MRRRKFLTAVGALTAGSAATLGTSAFEGAYINGDRSLELDVESDNNAYLKLISTSQYSSYESVSGGWEGGQGVSQLTVTIDRLNPNMDSRFDDIFRVQNTTGSEVELAIGDGPDWNGGYEDTLKIFAQPSGGGSPSDSTTAGRLRSPRVTTSRSTWSSSSPLDPTAATRTGIPNRIR
ncbi:hypothetical protein ACFQH8_03800 [Halomicroarcula sp. GCM10025710]